MLHELLSTRAKIVNKTLEMAHVQAAFKSAYVRPLVKKPDLDLKNIDLYQIYPLYLGFWKSVKLPYGRPFSVKQPP